MAKRYSARREACEESKVGRAPASSLRSAGLRSGAGGVRLSAASPRPDHRACGLSAPIRHAKCKPPKIVNDNSPSVGLRLGSMLLDHFILCFVLVPLWKIIDLASGSNEAFETPVWPFYVIVGIYLSKDAVGGQSLAKRILGLQVVDGKTGQPANEFQCFLRNMTIPVWLIEVVAVLFSPTRRIGDIIAGTRTVVGEKRAPFSLISDLRGRRPNRSTLLMLITAFIYVALLAWL